jgi:hypothetical protein
MSDQSALSVEEAARVLSNSRWSDKDEQAQAPVAPERGEDYGVRGVERGLGYEPMRPAMPVNEAAPDAFETAEQAADFVNGRRDQQVRPVDPIEYLESGGERAGQPMPENQTVSAEQAAYDLSNYRRGLGDQFSRAEDEAVRQLVDDLRNPRPVEQQAQISQPEAQPEQQQQAGADDEVARALQNPKVLSAIQEYVGQTAAQANAVASYYVQATQQNASAAAAALLHSYPELQGLTDPQQLQTAIQVVAKSNPQRAQQMVNHVEATRRVVDEWQRAAGAQQAAYQQAAQQEFSRWSNFQDAEFDSWAAKECSESELKAIQEESREMLKQEWGLTNQQLAQAWNSNPNLRSLPAQKMIYEAAKNRLARKSIATKLQRPAIPNVQRPGSIIDRPSVADAHQISLEKEFKSDPSPKNAARLVTYRRTRRP